MNNKLLYKYIFFVAVWLQHYTQDIKADCNDALGMQSGNIRDSQLNASHWLYRSMHYGPPHGRLNVPSAGGSWCSDDIHQNKNQYFQIDLLKNTKITAIATQGRYNSVEFIEAFQIRYKRDNENSYRDYEEVPGTWKKLGGNKDNQNIVKNVFKHSIIARTIRIYPRGEEFSLYCARLELYGCNWNHVKSAVLTYSAPLGAVKQGVDMKDSTYDGNSMDSKLSNGLGKLTDDIYGGKNSLLSGSGSPWVAYNTKNPEIKFEFQKKNVIKHIMIHVNNNNKDIKIFDKVEIFISSDNVRYDRVEEYQTNDEQRNKIGGFPVVINLGEVVAKYLKFKFTKQGDWLLLSEIVFMADTYPPKRVIPATTSVANGNNNNNNGGGGGDGNKPIVTFPPDISSNENEDNDESKGLSFPIILTIALVTIVLAAVVGIVVYKSYRKNRKQDSVRCNIQTQAKLITPEPKQDVGLLFDERIIALHHANQPATIIPQNRMYMQPMLQGNNVYNTQIMMS